jgi:hypothetical protein
MKVTGFTFIRNAVKLGYPVTESIRSILPLCNDFVVVVGNSDDGTLDLIQRIDPAKIKIIESIWDESPELKKGGKIYAVETDKALKAIPGDSDWAFYIQGDEVVHEKYLDSIAEAMRKWKDNQEVDGLLFNYLHFYGSYDYVANSPRWYKNEIRVVRNTGNIWSYRDAQGFRKDDNRKLNVKPVDAWIYHYGWVKEPGVMVKKLVNASSFYNGVKWLKSAAEKSSYDYSTIDSLQLFSGTHPAVMTDYIRSKNWNFDYDISFNKLSLRYKAKLILKDYLGIDTFYRNYNLI